MKKQNTHPELKNEERQRCEVWTRVMGYHRPVSEFNAGKQCEHQERLYFAEPSQIEIKEPLIKSVSGMKSEAHRAQETRPIS